MTEPRSQNLPEGIEQVWTALGQLRGSSVVAEARAYADARHEQVQRRRRFWQGLFPLAAAGLSVAAASVAVLFWSNPSPPVAAPIVYQTKVGEIRKETLADGSVIVLDTDTRIAVSFTPQKRQLTLLSGQGHFDVAHNTHRPFVVSFGKNSVTAVGTSFDVTALPNLNAVTLLSGRVVVSAKPRDAGPPRSVTLNPGQQVSIAQNGQLARPRAVDSATATAWQQGQLDLSDMPIADALIVMNRYSTRKISVKDADVLDKKISGIFKAGDTETAIDALTAYFGLHIVSQSENAIVLGR